MPLIQNEPISGLPVLATANPTLSLLLASDTSVSPFVSVSVTPSVLGKAIFGTGTNGQFAQWTSGAPAWGPLPATTWGSITGTLSAQSDLNTALGLKATLASPTFSGLVTAGGTFAVTGTSTLTGNVGIGGAASPTRGIFNQVTITGSGQAYADNATFAANGNGQSFRNAIFNNGAVALSTFTGNNLDGVYIATPSLTGAGTITTGYQLNIQAPAAGMSGAINVVSGAVNLGSGLMSNTGGISVPGIQLNGTAGFSTNPGSIEFSAVNGFRIEGLTGSVNDFSIISPGASIIMQVPTGTINTSWSGNMAVTGTSALTGNVAIGGVVQPNWGLYINATYSGTNTFVGGGMNGQMNFAINTQDFQAFRISPTLVTSTFTGLTYEGIDLIAPTVVGSGTIAQSAQIVIGPGATATSSWGILQTGTDQNRLLGLTGIGGVPVAGQALTVTGTGTTPLYVTSNQTTSQLSIDTTAGNATDASQIAFRRNSTAEWVIGNNLGNASGDSFAIRNGVTNYVTVTVNGLNSVGVGVGIAPTAGNILLASAGGGLGYATGAGGTVTQLTNKATAVTLNKSTGQITTVNSALTSGTVVSFALTNSAVAATDVLVLGVKSGEATAGSYQVWATEMAAGSCNVNIRNVTGGTLSEALVINYVVMKGANS